MQLHTATAVEKTPRLTKILTQEELSLINNPDSEQTKQYIFENLIEKERKIITTGNYDELILAIVNNMRKKDRERFRYLFCNHIAKVEHVQHYIFSQGPWLKTNAEFTKGGFSIEKYKREENHMRHKVFYLIKYTENMRIGWDLDNCGPPRKMPNPLDISG